MRGDQRRSAPRRRRPSISSSAPKALAAATFAITSVIALPEGAFAQTTAPVAATDAGGAEVARRSPELAAAWRSMDAEAYDAALAVFEQSLTVNLGRPELRVEASRGRAEALSLLGRHAEASSAFDALIRSAPSDPEVWHQRGLALYRAGNPGAP